MTATLKRLKAGTGKFMRVAVAVAVACFGLIGITQADPAKAAMRRTTDIPAQTLRPALQKLSKDHDLQLVFRTDVVGDLTTRGAAGDLTFEEALTQLLSGTGLTYRYLDEKTVTILPLPSGNSGAGKTHEEHTAPVTPTEVQKQSFWDRFRVAQVDRGSAGTLSASGAAATRPDPAAEKSVGLEEVIVSAQKRDERLHDVPVPVSVINTDSLASNGQLLLREYYNTVPGLNLAANYGFTQNLAIRGVTTGGFANPTVGITVDDVPYSGSSNSAGGNRSRTSTRATSHASRCCAAPRARSTARTAWVASSST